MGMFVEELKFGDVREGDYIEFTNRNSGNDESGKVVFVSTYYFRVEQWDKESCVEVIKGYFPGTISNITKIKL